MANTTDPYNPIFYANEALIVLENAMGMAKRVHRGYDSERKSANKGDTIQISKPGTFTAGAAPTAIASTQDVSPTSIDITLDQWYDVKFGLTDKELAYTGPKIISDHIAPAVYALASNMETALTNLYRQVPHRRAVNSTIAATDIVDTRKILRDNAGTIVDTDVVHYGIDSTLEAAFLNLELFHAASIAGEQDSMPTRRSGSLGTRFGVEHFVQQTLATHASGTVCTGADQAGALSADIALGTTTVPVNALAASETFKAGDQFTIAGDSQRYCITADATLSSNAATLSCWPPIKIAASSADVVTFEAAASSHADAYYSNIMFHKNAFAIAMAPLPMIGDGAGANMAVVTDPHTGLSIRSRLSYDDNTAQVIVTLDILYGVKVLDTELAVVARRNV